MEKINFLTEDFRFISTEEAYFIGVCKCETDYTEWVPNKKIEEGWGLFRGMTMVSRRGYDRDLPRLVGDTASFEDFDIYYLDIKINQLTYSELLSIIISDRRDNQIDSII